MRKILFLILIFAVIVRVQPNKPFKIGIALRGGGALGFAHIGPLEVLDSLEIQSIMWPEQAWAGW
ncbi:MAG: hypothetical protein E4H13_09500 [Calditrichales bacterium]|nr:MAG: hypothetical protein E4H13_09500 [Calditrichales bacterium]